MYRAVSICALLVVLLMSQNLIAKEMESVVVSGTVQSIAEDGNSFVLKTEDGAVTVSVDEDTQYNIDGEEASKAATLKVGATVTVTHTDALASLVNALTE